MTKGKKKTNLFFKILFALIIIYIALLIASNSGYYENKISNRTTLTKEAMIQFEEDIKNGEAIDIKNYLKDDEVDYSNTVTKIGNKLSNGLSDIMTKGIGGIFDVLKGLFW